MNSSVTTPTAVDEQTSVQFKWLGPLFEKPYTALIAAMGLAAVIRIYLLWQYYCISSDGVRYIKAAKDFYAGDISAGLASVYPPLYSLMIAGLYPLVGNWELTGQILSTLAGVFVLLPIFVLLRRIYGNNVAVVAAFLAAMSPFVARYSAHVRTEIPYLFLSTCALLLFHSGIKHRLWSRFFYGGLLAGLAYLTRPEGVGFLMVIPLALGLECWSRRTVSMRGVILGSALTLLGFLVFATPYAAHLAAESGDWVSISRKTNLATWYGFKDTGFLDSEDLDAIIAPGSPGLVQIALSHPIAYLQKVAWDIFPSVGVYFETIHYSYLPFLLLALWHAVRGGFWRRDDHLLFVFVGFYLLGFAALYVNLRYALQLVPASLGWVATGILWCLDENNTRRFLAPKYLKATLAVVTIGFFGGTLGKALRPISPEKAHVRQTGAYLKTVGTSKELKVLVFDDRITFYADAQAVSLYKRTEANLVQTLRDGGIDYLATETDPWKERFPTVAQNPRDYGLVLEKEFRVSGKGKILLFKVTRA